MDETSLHTQHFMKSSIKNREAEALHKSTRFPLDVDGNMVGGVTKRKKPFKKNASYYKAIQKVLLPEEAPIFQECYIEESNPERDNKIILYVKGDIKPKEELLHFFSQAGQIKSMLLSVDEVLKKLSVEIEFCGIKSVAVAVALAVKHGLSNVCPKAKNICVDSHCFPVEETEIERGVYLTEVDAFDRTIYIGFSHIPMTVDWLEKIFGVFGVVEKIRIPRPPNHIHLGFASLQFKSVDGKQEALCLNEQLKLSYKNVEVKMEVTAADGTE